MEAVVSTASAPAVAKVPRDSTESADGSPTTSGKPPLGSRLSVPIDNWGPCMICGTRVALLEAGVMVGPDSVARSRHHLGPVERLQAQPTVRDEVLCSYMTLFYEQLRVLCMLQR